MARLRPKGGKPDPRGEAPRFQGHTHPTSMKVGFEVVQLRPENMAAQLSTLSHLLQVWRRPQNLHLQHGPLTDYVCGPSQDRRLQQQ